MNCVAKLANFAIQLIIVSLERNFEAMKQVYDITKSFFYDRSTMSIILYKVYKC